MSTDLMRRHTALSFNERAKARWPEVAIPTSGVETACSKFNYTETHRLQYTARQKRPDKGKHPTHRQHKNDNRHLPLLQLSSPSPPSSPPLPSHPAATQQPKATLHAAWLTTESASCGESERKSTRPSSPPPP